MTVWGVCLNEVQDGLSIPTYESSVAFWDASTGVWHPLTWKSDTKETQITVTVIPVEFQFGWEVSFITMATNHKLRCCTCLSSVWCPGKGFLRYALVWGKVLVVCLALMKTHGVFITSKYYGPINLIIQLLKGMCGYWTNPSDFDYLLERNFSLPMTLQNWSTICSTKWGILGYFSTMTEQIFWRVN